MKTFGSENSVFQHYQVDYLVGYKSYKTKVIFRSATMLVCNATTAGHTHDASVARKRHGGRFPEWSSKCGLLFMGHDLTARRILPKTGVGMLISPHIAIIFELVQNNVLKGFR